MKNFLRQNWIWIVGPVVVVLILLVALAFYFGGDSSSPFIYPI